MESRKDYAVVSGGSFVYSYVQAEYVAMEIDDLLKDGDINKYPVEVLDKMREARDTLYKGAAMARRVDWLISGDDSIEGFLDRLKEDLAEAESVFVDE